MSLETVSAGPFYECTASRELIAAFETGAVKLICSENKVLFKQGEQGSAVYLVLAGEVGMFLPLTSEDGMKFSALAGSFVGLPAAFSNEPYSMAAVAMAGAQVAVMSRDKFCDLVASSPGLSLDVLRIMAAETRAMRISIVESGMSRRGRTRE